MKTKVWIKMNKKSQALRLRKWSKKKPYLIHERNSSIWSRFFKMLEIEMTQSVVEMPETILLKCFLF
jgi:hypothetical protein